jgi:uridylate kinase
MDNDLPIMVLDMWQENSLYDAVMGVEVGTIIDNGET